MDKQQMMLEALVTAIEKHHHEPVAFALVYGSYVTGLRGPKSDLDIVFVGKDERAFELQRTFVFEGVGYDFWCMSADRARRIVDEFQPLVSIFAEGRLIYADSPERRTWFSELQHGIRTASRDTLPTRYGRQVDELLAKMKALTFDHRLAGDGEKRHIQGKLVLLVGDMLARVNRTYFRSGMKRYFEEIAGFQIKPKTAVRHLELMLLKEVKTEDLVAFVADLQEFWTGVKLQHGGPVEEDLRGFYEEALSTWNKIGHAASSGDVPVTFLAATSLENELAGFRIRGVKLTSTFEGATEPVGIARNAETNRREFVELLSQKGVPIVEFNDFADVLRYISRGPGTPGGS